MIENIKKIWSKLRKDSRAQVVDVCLDEFDISKTYFLQNWIWGGAIPEDKQDRVLELLQNSFKLQIQRDQEIVA